MDVLTFMYKGRQHVAKLEVSEEEYPHFYWCFINDLELIEELGDCITFKKDEDGELHPAQVYPAKYQDLVAMIKEQIGQYLNRNKAI